jgi:hypothetical protein
MQAGTAMGNLASAIGVRTEDAALVAALKAGSEEAFGVLIAQYSQPLYTLISRHYAGSVHQGVPQRKELPWGVEPADLDVPNCAPRGKQPETLVDAA